MISSATDVTCSVVKKAASEADMAATESDAMCHQRTNNGQPLTDEQAAELLQQYVPNINLVGEGQYAEC